jgi:hypothetical protein
MPKSSANFVIQIGSNTIPTFQAGTTVAIPVYGYNSNSVAVAEIKLTGFALAFDLQGPAGENLGVGLPASLGVPTANFLGSVFGDGADDYLDVAPFRPNSYDVIAGNFGTEFIVATDHSTNKLFDFEFNVPLNAVEGTYSIVFVQNALEDGSTPVNNISGTATGGVTISSELDPAFGKFNITAVPEPSSMMLCVIGCGGALAASRRRRVAPKVA